MKKFRDMTDSEKLEIINAMIAGDPLEISCNDCTWYDSKDCQQFIVIDYYYRIPKRPMSIDWSVLKDEFICAARDRFGHPLAFTHAPSNRSDEGWSWDNTAYDFGDCCNIKGLKSYDPGTVDWAESLIWRPGYANNN